MSRATTTTNAATEQAPRVAPLADPGTAHPFEVEAAAGLVHVRCDPHCRVVLGADRLHVVEHRSDLREPIRVDRHRLERVQRIEMDQRRLELGKVPAQRVSERDRVEWPGFEDRAQPAVEIAGVDAVALGHTHQPARERDATALGDVVQDPPTFRYSPLTEDRHSSRDADRAGKAEVALHRLQFAAVHAVRGTAQQALGRPVERQVSGEQVAHGPPAKRPHRRLLGCFPRVELLTGQAIRGKDLVLAVTPTATQREPTRIERVLANVHPFRSTTIDPARDLPRLAVVVLPERAGPTQHLRQRDYCARMSERNRMLRPVRQRVVLIRARRLVHWLWTVVRLGTTPGEINQRRPPRRRRRHRDASSASSRASQASICSGR